MFFHFSFEGLDSVFRDAFGCPTASSLALPPYCFVDRVAHSPLNLAAEMIAKLMPRHGLPRSAGERATAFRYSSSIKAITRSCSAGESA